MNDNARPGSPRLAITTLGRHRCGPRTHPTRALGAIGVVLVIGAAAGCSSPPPAPPATPLIAQPPLPLPQAVERAVIALVEPIRLSGWAALFATKEARPVVVEPLLDVPTGQQATMHVEAARLLAQRLGKEAGWQVLPFSTSSLKSKPWVVRATLGAADAAGAGAPVTVLALALHDPQHLPVARSASAVNPGALNATPSLFDRDSPVLMRAPAAAREGPPPAQASGAATPLAAPSAAPNAAVDPAARDLESAMLLAEAQQAYEAGEHGRAAERYALAAARPGPHALRAKVGLYMSQRKLGRAAEATAAFGAVVDEGLARRSIELKLLFKPGSTEFWPDPAVNSAYGEWLEQIAARSARRSGCMEIVGHSSRTGTAEFNERLSLQRAQMVRERMQAAAALPDTQRRALGMGFRQNLVGSGTDDLRDAIDRRVEFRLIECPG